MLRRLRVGWMGSPSAWLTAMLDCATFLDRYTDFRDGLLPAASEAEFEAHVAECASCRRYDRVVRQGAQLVCGLPRLECSEDFGARLQHRLFHLEEEMRRPRAADSGAPLAAVLAIAATLAGVAWAPLLRPGAAPVQLPPVTAHAPHPVYRPPLQLGEAWLSAREAAAWMQPVSAAHASPLPVFQASLFAPGSPVHDAMLVRR